MFRLFEQNRLGSHDLVLLGTLCNIDAVTRHPDYARFVNLGMRAMLGQPGDEHREFVEAQGTAEDKTLALSFFTLFAHENRHFWDTITTPSGLRLMGAALEVQFEFISSCLPKTASGPIYLPFGEWVKECKQLAKLDARLASPPLEVAAFARSTLKFEQHLKDWEGAGASNSPISTQILEGLAVLSQAQAVKRHFGEPACKLFFGMLRAGDIGRWYLGAVDYLQQRLPELDLDGQALLLQMSLYCASDRPLADSNPAVLLRYLVEKFEATRPNFPNSFVEQFVLCDGYLSLLQGASPHLAFGQAGKRFFGRVNELGTELAAHPEAAPALSALLDYLARGVNVGAQLVQRVLFAGNVDNLRITHQAAATFDVPRAPTYFESPQGLILGGSSINDSVLPLVGLELEPGWKAAFAEPAANSFEQAMSAVPDGQATRLLHVFSPRADDSPEHLNLAWSIFPQLLRCRMAIAGPLETHALATVLLSQWLGSEGQTVYARGRLVSPQDDSGLG